ncbi:MAG: carbohydrate binding domain-containing protein, partial [Armatimonadota bacterium]|nr:carbohydrate binding domain-containing protein [Armatimonadota bacterium]
GAFPPKEEAPGIAARLAKYGFNAVRLHHYEGYVAPEGIWKASAGDPSRLALPREFDPVQLDRFDFLVAELIKRGIYINLNLHVGRKSVADEGVPAAGLLPDKDKGVNYYDERLIRLQQHFAAQLLSHVNPYTGRAYKDEPGLCAVEVSNENSLLGMWLDGSLSKVTPEHTEALRLRWNQWLQQRYSEASLRTAWTETDEPLLPTNLLAGPAPFDIINPDAPDARDILAMQPLKSFQLAAVTGAQGSLETQLNGLVVENTAQPVLTVRPLQLGRVPWSFQLNRDGIDLQAGQTYTLSFWARANQPRRISLNLATDRPPYRSGEFSALIDLTREWRRFTYAFRPTSSDPDHARLSWNLANQLGTVELSSVELRQGGRIALPEEWTLAQGIPLIDWHSTRVGMIRRDFAEFLGAVESEHVLRMRQFLKDRLGLCCPVWHSQAQFGGWGGVWRESFGDAIDVHAYWKHPDFSLDAANIYPWKVENASLTSASALNSDPLSEYSLFRVAGKPFVMSEWNSGQPSDFGGESLLMIAAHAAWQDWSAVYIFDYHSSGSYNRNHIEGFFSIDSHPVKMATAPAAALIFRRAVGQDSGPSPVVPVSVDAISPPPSPPSARPTIPLPTSPSTPTVGDVAPSQSSVTLTMPRDQVWQETATAPGGPMALPIVNTWRRAGARRGVALRSKTAVRFEAVPELSLSRVGINTDSNTFNNYLSDTRQINWNKSESTWTVNTPRSKAAVGFWGGRAARLDELRIGMPRSMSNFAAFALSSLDGSTVRQSRRLLLTATGRAENLGMGWNAERNSVGSQWGYGPTRVEGITANVQLATTIRGLRVWALDVTGERKSEIATHDSNGILSFAISPRWQTLWYEISQE